MKEEVWKIDDLIDLQNLKLYPVRRSNPDMIYYALTNSDALALVLTLNDIARKQQEQDEYFARLTGKTRK